MGYEGPSLNELLSVTVAIVSDMPFLMGCGRPSLNDLINVTVAIVSNMPFLMGYGRFTVTLITAVKKEKIGLLDNINVTVRPP